ncbi:Proteasome subunit beta type-1 [Gurleya vavrai]
MFNEEVSTGTTIMAIKYKDGIIIGADTRTSMGSYIANHSTNKLTKLTEKIFCCRSGSAADTKIITDIATNQIKGLKYSENIEPTVKRLSILCKNMIYNYPQLHAGLILAGYDSEEKGSIYEICLGGTIQKMKISIGGSGSGYIFGFCDKYYDENFSKEEGIQFVKDAVSMAIYRDNFSGGNIRMAVINENGVERLFVPGNEIK